MPASLARASLLALLAISSALALSACSDNGEGSSADQAAVVEQLRKNAEDFEYAIGTPGGILPLATTSEPLTFNLAIATDGLFLGGLGVPL